MISGAGQRQWSRSCANVCTTTGLGLADGQRDLGNQGIHQMDIARWFLGENELSPRVFAVGGRLGYIDDGTTPNTQIVYHDYPKAPLIF